MLCETLPQYLSCLCVQYKVLSQEKKGLYNQKIVIHKTNGCNCSGMVGFTETVLKQLAAMTVSTFNRGNAVAALLSYATLAPIARSAPIATQHNAHFTVAAHKFGPRRKHCLHRGSIAVQHYLVTDKTFLCVEGRTRSPVLRTIIM